MEKFLTFQTKNILKIMSSKFVITKNVCDNLDSINLGQKIKKINK